MSLYFVWTIARLDDVCWVLLVLTQKTQGFQGINIEIHVCVHTGTNTHAREHRPSMSLYFLKTVSPYPTDYFITQIIISYFMRRFSCLYTNF